jgi:hypothetical protein
MSSNLMNRRRFAGIPLAFAGASVLSRLPAFAAMAQDSMNQPDGTYLIAHGEDRMPTVPVSWRLITNTAKPEDDAPELPRTLHFIMPTSESPFVVDNLTTGDSVKLVTHTAHAVFGAEGDVEKRYVESGAPAPYVAFELIVADADDPSTIGSGMWLGATPPFTAPSGRQEMILSALVVNAADPIKPVPEMGTDYPVIAYVQGEPITIIDASNRWIPFEPGEAVVLEAGDSLRFAGDDNSGANASLVFARFLTQVPD